MSSTQLSSPGLIARADLLTTSISFLLLYVGSVIIGHVYSAFYGPLSKFPGPKFNALTIFPWCKTLWKGDDNVDIIALHEEYGQVVRIGPNQLSFSGNGQIWKEIYGFRKHGQLEAIKDPAFYGQNVNRTPGLITADYQTHARQRKIVSHAFSDKALKEQEPLLKTWAEKLRAKLTEQAQRGQKSDMLKMLNCTTFDIMSALSFSEPLYMLENSEYVPWVRNIFGGIKFGAIIRAFKLFSTFNNWLLNETLFRLPSLRKKQMIHWNYTTDRVDRRLSKTPDSPDLWTVILERGGPPTHDNQPDPSSLSLQEHYAIASLFMIAGTETTATALSGTLYQLLQNPESMKNVQEEIRSAFDNMDDVHLDPLAKLPILEATLKEGIRMYPPVPIGLPRISPPGGMTVGGHFVPEGTSIAVHQLSTYRQEENFLHAFEFRPERWLGDPEFENDKSDAFEPFSVGPRNCLGKNLAWHEMRLLLSTILLHFDIELSQESEHWADQKVYTLWEKHPLMCRLKVVKT